MNWLSQQWLGILVNRRDLPRHPVVTQGAEDGRHENTGG